MFYHYVPRGNTLLDKVVPYPFFFRLLLDAIPFLSCNITLRLSWNRTHSLVVKPCSSIKYQFHIILGMASLAPINYDYVGILAFIFCFFAIPVTEPLPSDMVAPVGPLIPVCATYEASTHHLITVSLYVLRISGMLIVLHTYLRTRFYFLQSSSSGIRTLVVRKIAVWISFCALGHANSTCATS